MEAFLEYIMLNYTWFLGGAIIILLAIIGYYADETNFGQGKDKKDNNFKLDEVESNIEEIIEEPIQETIDNSIEEPEDVLEQSDDLINLDEIENINQEIQDTNFEEEFEKFDKEFNEILPEKEIISDELLDEIENLSIDKTQKLDLSDIPDLDDVELPKIKLLEPEEQDVWKF